jgi:hypothetical protein
MIKRKDVPCAQKKCLIHLMRDINEDLYKNPFDEDLKEIAGRFGVLLRGIVETIDSYGLKARNLSKHKKAALGFVEHVVAMKCEAEAGLALQKRIETPPCHERLGDHRIERVLAIASGGLHGCIGEPYGYRCCPNSRTVRSV